MRVVSFLIVLMFMAAQAILAQTQKSFPTDDEINLLLTQTERAIQQYKPLIDQEQVQMGKDGAEAAANGWPTLSFGVLILPKKWVPHPSLFSSEGWVYRQLRQLPKIFSANFPVNSLVKPLNAQKTP
jgi:restriction endonuclease S subunit